MGAKWEQTILAMSELSQKISLSCTQIETLNASTDNIGHILDVIKGISQQTHCSRSTPRSRPPVLGRLAVGLPWSPMKYATWLTVPRVGRRNPQNDYFAASGFAGGGDHHERQPDLQRRERRRRQPRPASA